MRITIEIDPSSYRSSELLYDIQAFLHFMARDRWQITEDEDFDGCTLLTVDFRDPVDAADFQMYREIRHHVRRS